MAKLEVTVPEDYAGSVMGDVSASRGRIEGMNAGERGTTVIQARVPYAEVLDYATRCARCLVARASSRSRLTATSRSRTMCRQSLPRSGRAVVPLAGSDFL